MDAILEQWRPAVAELVGTMMLVFVGSSAVYGPPAHSGDKVPMVTYSEFDSTALRFGIGLLVLAMALGPISGAHFNPAVSLAQFIVGRLALLPMGIYMAAQILGALLGATLAHFITGYSSLAVPLHIPGSPGITVMECVFVEMLATVPLILVVLGATDPAREEPNPSLTCFGAGLALALGHWVAQHITGASLNPFRALASSIIEGDGWKYIWIPVAMPFAAAAAAAFLYKFVFDGQTAKQQQSS